MNTPTESRRRSRYPALQWLYALLSIAGSIFIVAGLGFAVTRHASEQDLSNAIRFWSLAGGLFMGLVSFSLAAIMRLLLDLAVQSGLAEPPRTD